MARIITTKPKDKKTSLLKNVGDFIASAGGHGVSKVAEAGANLAKMTDYINPVSYLQKAFDQPTFGEGAQKAGKFIAEQPLKSLKYAGQDKTMGGKIGGVVGDVAGTVAGVVPSMAGGSALLGAIKAAPSVASAASAAPKLQKAAQFIQKSVEKYPLLAKATDFAAKSVGTTTITTGAERGEAPTAKEVGLYGLMDVALLGLGKLGGSLYRSAFRKGATVTQQKNYVKQFKQTIGDTAEQLGYAGTARQIKGKARATKKTVWDRLKRRAKQSAMITPDDFSNVKSQLLKPYKKLPDTPYRNEMIASIGEVVDSFTPSKPIPGDQVVDIIGQINAELFGEGQRMVLTPKLAKSITSDLKLGLKDKLPPEVKKLYKDYSVNRLIEEVMGNDEIKKILTRMGIGATSAGSTAGISTAVMGGNTGDVVKNAILGAIAGALMGKAHSSTFLRTGTGKGLKQLSQPSMTLLIKTAVDDILQKLGQKEETTITQ